MASSEVEREALVSGPSSDPDEPADPTMDAAFELPDDARPSVFVCPECSGTLWETDPDGVLGFRCRVGHAYTLGTFEAAQASRVEQALWVSMRALDERASLARRLAKRAERTGQTLSAEKFHRQARETEHHLEAISDLLQEVAAPDALAGEA